MESRTVVCPCVLFLSTHENNNTSSGAGFLIVVRRKKTEEEKTLCFFIFLERSCLTYIWEINYLFLTIYMEAKFGKDTKIRKCIILR